MDFVFIVGCQRSGTTLVGQFMGAHPNTVLIDEDQGVYDLVESLLGDSENLGAVYSDCLAKAQSNYIGDERFSSRGQAASHITHTVLKVPNATFDFERFRHVNNERFHYIHMVRDVRDVVCSMQRLVQVPMVENQVNQIERRPEIAALFERELVQLRNRATPDHVRRALVWKIKTGLYREIVRAPLNGLKVRYEDLVTSPKHWSLQMISHVGLERPGDEHVEHQNVMKGQGPGYTLRGRPVDTASLSRWKRQLDSAQESEVWNVAGELMSELNYVRSSAKVDAPQPPARDVLSRPVVAVGRGGSGTRLLSVILQEHGVFLGNELNVSHDSIEWADLVYEIHVRKLHAQLLEPAALSSELIARASHVLGKHQGDATGLWGWKLPETLIVAPEIADALPASRIIHLVRHPVTSNLRRAHTTARMDHPIGRQTLRAAYAEFGWSHDPSQDPDHIRNAISWVFQVGNMLDACRQLGSRRYLELRFEDVINDPQRESEKVGNFLCKDFVVSKLPGAIVPDRARMWKKGDGRAAEVWEICKDLAERFGYDGRDDGIFRR